MKKFSLKDISIDKWILIGIAGVILLIFQDGFTKTYGTGDKSNERQEVSQEDDCENKCEEYVSDLEKKLEKILSSIEGVGKCRVMITVERTEEDKVLKEEREKESLVVFSEEDGSKIPYVISRQAPEIRGVAVVAQGGGSSVVKEKISSVIKALFGMEINKIAIGKMN